MSGRVRNRVLGPGPGGTQGLGSRSPGPGGRGFLGLAAALVLPAAPAMDGSAAQTPPGPVGGRTAAARWAGEPASLQQQLEGAMGRGRGWGEDWTLAALGLLGSERGVLTASAARPATDTRGQEAVSRGWSGAGVCGSRTGVPREVEGESGARAGKRVKVGIVLSEVPAPEPARPAVAAPREWLEEVTGEGAAGGAVEVLKILAKKDPRSNTATFIFWPLKCCPGCCPNLKSTGSQAPGLHPPPSARIWRRQARAGSGVLGSPQAAHPRTFWCCIHAEGPLRTFGLETLGPDLPQRWALHPMRGSLPSLPYRWEILRARGPGAYGGHSSSCQRYQELRMEIGASACRPLQIPRRPPGIAQVVAKPNKNPA